MWQAELFPRLLISLQNEDKKKINSRIKLLCSKNIIDIVAFICYYSIAVSIARQYLQDEEENPSLTHNINKVYRDRVKAY